MIQYQEGGRISAEQWAAFQRGAGEFVQVEGEKKARFGGVLGVLFDWIVRPVLWAAMIWVAAMIAGRGFASGFKAKALLLIPEPPAPQEKIVVENKAVEKGEKVSPAAELQEGGDQ